MGSFRRDRRSGGGRGGDSYRDRDRNYGGRSYGGRDSGGSTMYSATCDQCGKPCEVPFRPSGEKPVYCSECFENRGDRYAGQDRYDDRNSRRSSFSDRPMYSATCDKCGKECQVPFRPSGDSPVYCRDCFKDTNSGRGGGSSAPAACNCEESKKLLEEINQKLDKIMRDLGTTKFIRVPAKKGVSPENKQAKVVEEVPQQPSKSKDVLMENDSAEVKTKTKKKKSVTTKKAVKETPAEESVEDLVQVPPLP